MQRGWTVLAIDPSKRVEAVERNFIGITWPGRTARRTPAPRRAHSLDLVEVDADVVVGIVSLLCWNKPVSRVHVEPMIQDAQRQIDLCTVR